MFRLPKTFFVSLLISCSLLLAACGTIDLYEKVTPIPGHEWKTSFKPKFSFTISDTTRPYGVYVVLRHNDRYNYNNIWLRITTQSPGDSALTQLVELPLADREKGWLGTGMHDLYEHRAALVQEPVDLKKGDYSFTVEQVMRDNPLAHVMNVGIRLEKK